MSGVLQLGLTVRLEHSPGEFFLGRLLTRHQPIMLIFPPIMLCCSAQNFDLLCSILCLCKNDLCLKSDCSIRVCSLVTKIISYGECSIRVYQVYT